MQIISWNIQMAKGVDDVVDMNRIASIIKGMGNADVICCQEVFQQFGHNVDHSEETISDQAQLLSANFPDYTLHYGPAIDRLVDGNRIRFGNLVLSRLPILSVTNHKLPQPADPNTKNMARQAIELMVDWDGAPYRIVSTHLEYFSAIQRRAHVEYLHSLHKETRTRAQSPSTDGGEGMYAPAHETKNTIFCGDFNLTPFSDTYKILTDPGQDADLIDVWTMLHPRVDHAPTCGIFDTVQWPEGPHCRDFFFVAPELKTKIIEMTVNIETSASDHQPIKLALTDH